MQKGGVFSKFLPRFFFRGLSMNKLELCLAFFSADLTEGRLFWARDVPRRYFKDDRTAARYAAKYAGRPVKSYAISKHGHAAARVPHHGQAVNVLVHRAIWALAHGAFPEGDLDHVNRDPTDNRLANLRPATRGDNGHNSNRRKPGLKGAYQDKRGHWFSAVWDGQRLRHLGRYSNAQEAHEAWVKAKAPIVGRFFSAGYLSVFD